MSQYTYFFSTGRLFVLVDPPAFGHVGCNTFVASPLFESSLLTHNPTLINNELKTNTHNTHTTGIELTWNYGTEKEEGMVYNTGNADTTGTADGNKIRGGMSVVVFVGIQSLSCCRRLRFHRVNMKTYLKGIFATPFITHTLQGFGHLGITVPNVYRACQRFHSLGVAFHKSPNSGGMKGLAFIKDPDGYLIEVLPRGEMVVEDVDCLGVESHGGDGYKDNSK